MHFDLVAPPRNKHRDDGCIFTLVRSFDFSIFWAGEADGGEEVGF
jgi:hypothetical protein